MRYTNNFRKNNVGFFLAFVTYLAIFSVPYIGNLYFAHNVFVYLSKSAFFDTYRNVKSHIFRSRC